MMQTAFWVTIEVGAVATVLYSIYKVRPLIQWFAKPAASVVFVFFGLTRTDFSSAFDRWMMVGLILGLAGDVLLIDRRTFRWGLLTFLAGHAAYIAAFSEAQPPSTWSILVLLPLIVAGAAVAKWLWPHTKKMRRSVSAYILVITLMAWGGIAVSISGALPVTAAVGAILFFLSDLAVARNKFIHTAFINRAIGLPAYYAGQMLLASTIGILG